MSTPPLPTVDDPRERHLFSTVRIVATRPNGDAAVGTGFFFVFAKTVDGGHVPTIVTNRHVIEGADTVDLVFRRSSDDLSRPIIGGGIPGRMTDIQNGVIYHPDSAIDLCVIPITNVIHLLNQRGDNPWFAMHDTGSLKMRIGTPPLRAIENILMIGYPIGLWDEANDMPIARRGITATHPALNWRGLPEFLIDAACFPGSSGSPVYLDRERRHTDMVGKQIEFVLDCRLLGILSAGPQFDAEGKIEIRNIPTGATAVPMTRIPTNLGVVIKAEKLLDFDSLIKEKISSGTFPHVAKRTKEAPDDDSTHLKPIIEIK